MFKSYSVLILFLLMAGLGFGQTKEVDSLKNLLVESESNDTTLINTYQALTRAFIPVNIDSTEKYAEISLQKALKNNDYGIVMAYVNKGIVLDIKSKSDSARIYYDKALVELDKNDNRKERSVIYSNYSLSYQNTSRMDLALKYNAMAIELDEGNENGLCLLYFNQAMLYFRSEIPESGKKYLRLAYESSKKANNLRVEGAAIHSFGYTYVQEKKLDSARFYLEKGLRLCEITKSPETCFRIHSALGDLYLEMNLAPEAYDAILKAKEYAKQRNKTDDILLSLVQLGELENTRNNYENSAKYFQEFEALYQLQVEEKPMVGLDAYKLWSDTEFKRANYKKSYELLKQHVDFKDSIYTMKNKELLTEADAKFESEKKDKEIAEQELALADQKLALTESKSKTRTMSILIVSLLSASILLWFLFQQRQKRIQQQLVTIQREQEVRTLESLMEGEEKERFRIAKELHDGVNGDLSAIKFKLSSLLEMNNSVIKEAVTMIDNSCEQVRAISHNLVPPSLKDFNLVEAVNEYCQSMDSIHDPEVNFQQVGNIKDIDKKQEANLFRVVQELVTNSIKHAEAKEINVQLSHLENTLQLTVEDNGKGFDPKTVKSDGIGMQNVQSRVDYLNATMDFVSNEKGTSYTIAIDTKNQET